MKRDTEQGVLNAYNKVTGVNNTVCLVEHHFLCFTVKSLGIGRNINQSQAKFMVAKL